MVFYSWYELPLLSRQRHSTFYWMNLHARLSRGLGRNGRCHLPYWHWPTKGTWHEAGIEKCHLPYWYWPTKVNSHRLDAGSADARLVVAYKGYVLLIWKKSFWLYVGKKSVKTIELSRVRGLFPNIWNTLAMEVCKLQTPMLLLILVLVVVLYFTLEWWTVFAKKYQQKKGQWAHYVLHAGESAILYPPSTLDSSNEDDPLANKGFRIITHPFKTHFKSPFYF